MVAHHRIGPDGAFADEFRALQNRVRSIETAPAGQIVIRETMKTIDPETGVETIFGKLPDGSYGLEPFVGDTVAPPVATTPLVAAQPGLVTLGWDGTFVAGAEMPRDFKHLNIIGYKIVDGADVSRTIVGVIRTAKDTAFVSSDVFPEDETWKFAFESVDYNGNLSAESNRSDLVTMLSIVSDARVSQALSELETKAQDAQDAADNAQGEAAAASAAAIAAQKAADAAVAAGQNLVLNGDFEKDNENWNTTATAYTRTSVSPRSGTKVMFLDPSAANVWPTSGWTPSSSGRTYYMEAWFKRIGTAAAGETVGFVGQSGTTAGGTSTSTVGEVAGSTISTTEWTKVTATYTIPSNIDVYRARFAPWAKQSSADYEVDNMLVVDTTESKAALDAAAAAQSKADQAFNNAATAASAAGTAQTTANNKNTSWYIPDAPAGTAHKVGDIWFDTNDNHKVRTWDGAQWVTTQDSWRAQEVADSKSLVYTQDLTPPVEARVPTTIWNDTSLGLDKIVVKYWSTTTNAWTPITDKVATEAKTTAEAKAEVIYSDSEPAASKRLPQNLWVDTTGGININKRWDGNAWIVSADKRIADTVTNLAATDSKLNTVETTANTALSSANGKNKNYYQTTQPSGGTYITGDMWFDTDDNYKMYTYTGSTWQLTQDSNTALTTANSKNKTFIQGTAPTASAAGDIWIDTANGNQLKRWSGSAWADARDTTIATAQSTANTAQTAANGKNKVIYASSLPVGTDFVHGDTVFIRSAIGQPITAQYTWDTPSLTWKAEALSHQVIASVDLGKATVGELDGIYIKTKSLDADKVVIGRGSNLYMDEAISDTANYSNTGYFNATAGKTGRGAIVIPTGSTQAGTYYAIGNTAAHKARRARVVPGQSYRIGAWVKTSAEAPLSTIAVYARLYRESDNTFITTSPSNITNTGTNGQLGLTTPDTWHWLSGVVPIPAGTDFTGMVLGFYKQTGYTTGTTTFSDPVVQQMGSGELLVDGTITAGSAIIADGAIGTAKIGDAQITTAKITDLAVTDAKISAINAGKITAGSIDAARIAANSISVSKLSVTDITNFAPSLLASPGDWLLSGGMAIVDTTLDTSGKRLNAAGNTATAWAYGPFMEVRPGESLYASAMVYRSGTATSAVWLRYYWYDKAKVLISGTNFVSAPQAITSPNGTKLEIASAVVPANTAYARLVLPAAASGTGQEVGFYTIVGRRQFAGELIVDGAINGKTITGATIQSETTANRGIKLTSTELAGYDGAGLKNFSLSSAGALTLIGEIKSGSTIEGATITGSTGIQTSATAARGVKLSNTGIVTYDSSGNMTFKVDGTTGLVEAPGLKANSITGDKIVAGSIQADKLIVSQTTNAIVDPGFNSPEITALRTANSTGGSAGWTLSAGTVTGLKTLTRTTTSTADTLYLRTFAATAAMRANAIPVVAGQRWIFTVDVETNISAGVRWNLNGWYADDSVPTWVSASPYSTASGRRPLTYVFTVPAGMVAMYPALICDTSGVVWKVYGNVFVAQQSEATMIRDGAITTTHMTSGTIDASVITSGTISSSHIKSKSILADRLVISSTDNLVVEADFNNSGTSWQLDANMTINATAGRGSRPAFRVTGTTAAKTSLNLVNKVPVGSEDRFRASMWVKSSAALAIDTVRLMVRCYTTATAYTDIIGTSNTAALVAATWTNVGGIVPALPANTIAAEFFLQVTNNATGTITDIDYVSVTRAADGNLVVDGTITSKKLETDLILSTNIIAGDPTGTHARMSGTGFRVFADALEEGAPSTEVVRLGVASTNDYFAITAPNGLPVASISEDGTGSFQKATVTTDLTYRGDELTTILSRYAKGIRTYGYLSFSTVGPTEIGMGQVHFNAEAGRAYRVHVRAASNASSQVGSTKLAVRTSNTGTPTINSTRRYTNETLNSTSGHWHDINFSFIWYPVPPSGQTSWKEEVLVTGQHISSPSANITIYDLEISIEDIGIKVPDTMSVNNGGGTLYNASPPPTAPSVTNYVKQYGCTNSMNYKGDNAQYLHDTGKMYQGLSPAGYGNLKSIAVFNDMTADLSGATVNYVRVYFNFTHWYYNAGGTARIGVHGHTSVPGSYTSVGPLSVISGSWPKPGARWVDLSSSHWEGFKTGAYRGVYLEGDSQYGTYGIAERPVIEIGYTK